MMGDIPWVEKYRPKILSEVVGNRPIIERFENMIETGSIPNMLISGPSGSGKTASIICIAKQILGDHFRSAVLEQNSSDDRGIKTVREHIKTFVSKKVNLPDGAHKIIILDEADSMTPEAQKALLSIIEMYSQTTRFVFLCNTSKNIIEAIQSRCKVVRFSHLSAPDIKYRLMEIARKEDVKYDDKGLQTIINNSNGDMRIAINNLQSCFYGYEDITEQNVYRLIDIPHPQILKKMIQHILQQDFKEALQTIATLYQRGYDNADIINTILQTIKGYDMPDRIKLEFLNVVGQYYIRITEAIDSRLQMDGLVAALYNIVITQKEKKHSQSTGCRDTEFAFKLI